MKPLLLVDGYNVIGAWDVPRSEHLSIDEARERLVHMIADYAGFSGEEVIVVFDGHYTDRTVRSHTTMHGVEVIFTKHAESADNFIEAQCAAAPKWRQVRVATSDSIEQTVTMGRGAVRISSREFLLELTQTRMTGRVRMQEEKISRGDIFSRLPPHQREIFERMRRGIDEEEEKEKKAAANAAAKAKQQPQAKNAKGTLQSAPNKPSPLGKVPARADEVSRRGGRTSRSRNG